MENEIQITKTQQVAAHRLNEAKTSLAAARSSLEIARQIQSDREIEMNLAISRYAEASSDVLRLEDWVESKKETLIESKHLLAEAYCPTEKKPTFWQRVFGR